MPALAMPAVVTSVVIAEVAVVVLAEVADWEVVVVVAVASVVVAAVVVVRVVEVAVGSAVGIVELVVQAVQPGEFAGLVVELFGELVVELVLLASTEPSVAIVMPPQKRYWLPRPPRELSSV